MICPGEPHQRNLNAPKFEDRSQEETEWQEQRAREAAWKLAKNIKKLKEKEKTVVDSGASMHMISKKDLNSSELETLTTSRSPTTVITATGEVLTHEEPTVYVKELDIFLTMKFTVTDGECEEYTSKYRKLATETLLRKRRQQHEQ